MGKIQTLVGPQVTELYLQTMDELATLRAERANINENIKEKVAEARELRKYVRLFDPAVLNGEKTPDELAAPE